MVLARNLEYCGEGICKAVYLVPYLLSYLHSSARQLQYPGHRDANTQEFAEQSQRFEVHSLNSEQKVHTCWLIRSIPMSFLSFVNRKNAFSISLVSVF
jgi:hypothetical protein